MLKKLYYYLKPEGFENIETPENVSATFYLYFKSNKIGELRLNKKT